MTETPAGNSTYKKLAVQWLNEHLCFVSSSVVADSFRLRNRQLLVAANRYRALAKTELNMKINLDKTLEQIEKEYWPEPNHDSYLVRTCHLLRKKPVADFEIEDLRILISQNISLNVLLPIALDKLKENVFAEGDFYEGDLLISILTSDPKYWVDNKSNWKAVC